MQGAALSRRPVARTAALPDELVSGLVEKGDGQPRAVWTGDGYVRAAESGVGNWFKVPVGKRVSAADAAAEFVEEHKQLFTDNDPGHTFVVRRIRERGQRTYVRYAQEYGGIEVFGAEMVVQVNAAGGIEAVTSDVMRHAKTFAASVSTIPRIEEDQP